MQKYGRFRVNSGSTNWTMSRRCGSSKPTPTPLTVWRWSQEHAKKSSGRKRRPYNEAKVTHQKPAAYRRCDGGGAEKALEPAAYRRYGGGGAGKALRQNNHRKGTMARRGSSIWREHRRKHKGEVMRKTSRGPSAWRGARRRNDKYAGWKVAASTAPRGGEVFSRKNKVEQIQHTKK